MDTCDSQDGGHTIVNIPPKSDNHNTGSATNVSDRAEPLQLAANHISAEKPPQVASNHVSAEEPSHVVTNPVCAEEPSCRICFRGESTENLLTPCLCKGTIGYVHRFCLERWLTTTDTENCDICHFRYTVEKTPRHWWQWCSDPTTKTDRRALIGCILYIAISTPFVAHLVWFCLRKSEKYSTVPGSMWYSSAMASIAMCIGLMHCTWIMLSIKKAFKRYLNWKQRNFSISVFYHCPRTEISERSNSEVEEERPTCSTWPIAAKYPRKQSLNESFSLLKGTESIEISPRTPTHSPMDPNCPL